MNKTEYTSLVEAEIKELVQDRKFNNNKKQIFAWRLKANFQRTYNEQYLWNRCLNLTSNACFLLQNDRNNKSAIIALKECGEIYEYLSEITEGFDVNHALILSSLSYNISGYQANSYCIISRIDELLLSSDDINIDLEPENVIIEHIRLILLNKIPQAKYSLNFDTNDLGLHLFLKAISKWYDKILMLHESDYLTDLHLSYQYYLNEGNVFLSQLIFLLETRLMIFEERSIWNNIRKTESIEDNIYWQKYVKLLSNDMYSSFGIKDINNRFSRFELWISQIRAVEKELLNSDKNFVIQMPTSSGKTFVAELAILKHLVDNPDKKCIYVAPFRALTSEKENELSLYFSKLGYSVSSLTGSYEIDEFQDVILEKTDVLVATPEKIDLLLRVSPEFFENISFIVVDEGHIIGDISSRAILLEFLLIRLRIKIAELRTLFISAVMPPKNANEYALWLGGDKDNVLRSLQFSDSPITEEWEPTRKLISRFMWEGQKGVLSFEKIDTGEESKNAEQRAFVPSFLIHKEIANKYPRSNNKVETAAALAFKLAEEGNVLVFCAQVRRTESIANVLLELLSKIIEKQEFYPDYFLKNTNKASSYYARIWYGKDSYITKSIDRGIGIHFGDMAEAVRNAVENDFRNGKLRVLLATNTIGQGINFPIKNLVIYEMSVGRSSTGNIYIENRDFWNIIGRVGRANKETEGRVIYIINSPNDKRLYEKYIDKKNIEKADSLLFKALLAYERVDVDKKRVDDLISQISETYLLDLITEEIIETDFQEIIEQIINNSLFKVQADERNIDIQPLRNSFASIYNGFKEQASFEQLNTYGKTGFSFKTNKIIDEYIDDNILTIQKIIEEDDYIQLLFIFLKLLQENAIDEMLSQKLERISLNPIDAYPIINKWIQGNSLVEIRAIWKQSDIDSGLLNVYISEALYYLYPWGITTLTTLICNSLKIELHDLPENIKNLSSYVKYGLNVPTACLARSLGIKSREIALFLHMQSNEKEGVAFLKWLSNLTYEEISEYEISDFEKNNIYEVSSKLTPNSFKEIPKVFRFSIKGITYEDIRKLNSKTIVVGDVLDCKRDYQNQYDPYAIKFYKEEKEIGFVPREYSKVIASDIDINETRYRVRVVNVIENKSYNRIEVKMKAVE